MIDAKTYTVEETLKNGIPLIVRAIRGDDKEEILESFEMLPANDKMLNLLRKSGLPIQIVTMEDSFSVSIYLNE